MKRIALAMLFACTITVAIPIRAEVVPTTPTDEYDDMQSHPLRVAAYLAYPIGYTLEWLIFRPFHRLVAEPSLAPVFGHVSHSDEASVYYK